MSYTTNILKNKVITPPSAQALHDSHHHTKRRDKYQHTVLHLCASISAVIGALARLTESWNEASYLATVAIG